MSSNLIEANNISRAFGKRKILDELNFTLKEGEIVAVLGESGAGKSTLLNILGLLDKEFEGELIVDGKKITSKKDYSYIRSSSMGFVFQSYYLLSRHTVKENILLPFYYNNIEDKELDDRIKEICTRLKIIDLMDQISDDLSGGEKQRCSIARAIISRPKIIICDEPTGNLDEKNADIVLNALKEEKSRGAGIVVVTHNVSLAERCDRILLLKDGKLNEKDN